MKITLCIDKQARNNPSSELRQYSIDIGCPLRSYEGVFDELKISTDDTNKLVGIVLRRCYVDKYGVLKKLDSEEIQELEISEITLFEGTNYVYIQEFTNLNMKIEYLTNAEMNKYFATKAEMNSSIKQTYDSILLTVLTKADKTELQTAISLLTDEIDLRVIKDEIISAINMSPETITILANKLGLTANDVLDIIAGNAINLTTKNISFVADNFSVDKYGNLITNSATLNNATINGGVLNLVSTNSKDPRITINGVDSFGNNTKTTIDSSDWFIENNDKQTWFDPGSLSMRSGNSENQIWPTGCYFVDRDAGNTTRVEASGITTPKLSQTSLESKKKNFKLFNKGLELINNSDFYLYNMKDEKDGTKKHIGLVIGKKYNTPTEFINQSEDGIDLYSLISACGDAIKTLNNRIIELEKQIKEMK